MQVNIAGCPGATVGGNLEWIRMVSLPFRDRDDAARQLAQALRHYRGTHPVVLAIPRGAVPMGRILADALEGELDVVLVRKIGAPGNPELAIGAVDERGSIMLTEHARWVGADEEYVRSEAKRQMALIAERRASYRPGKPGVGLRGRTVIVVDDGLATGSTMCSALRAVRAQKPARLVCAVPVAGQESHALVSEIADEVICLATPPHFRAVGQFYVDFRGVTDEQVMQMLAAHDAALPRSRELTAGSRREVRIRAGRVVLEGDLVTTASPAGLVIFVHGSGSSRHSPRNRLVAESMNERGLSTLLFDLLTPEEDADTSARFNISLLAQRLEAALAWARGESETTHEHIGLFGASTGAAAALVAAGDHAEISAIVSRGGRPDLAGRWALSQVHAPTLLIVGGADHQVLELNRAAQAAMPADAAQLVVVPGASHLFEEPGALERVAELASDWFLRWFLAHPEQQATGLPRSREGNRPDQPH